MKKITLCSLLLALACSGKLPEWISNPSAWDNETHRAFVGHVENVDDESLAVILATIAAFTAAEPYMKDDFRDNTKTTEQCIIIHRIEDECGEQVELYEAYVLVLVPRRILKDEPNQPPQGGVRT